MKKLLIISIILLVCGAVSAQDFTIVLQQIEQNNTSLKALREQVDADKMASRTSLAPADPEVEVNYLWGNAVAEGNRFDLNAMQQFDFPTAYYYRKKIAEGRCSVAEWRYAVGRRGVLQQAELCCVEWVYRNAMQAELNRQLKQAEQLGAAYQKKFDKGECGILERNKAQLNVLNIRHLCEQNELEAQALRMELARLNGGQPIEVADSVFAAVSLPLDFETWYAEAEAGNAVLNRLSEQSENASWEVKLGRSLWLPKLAVGYQSERIGGSVLQGIGAGISIPLWENSGKVRAAQARQVALQAGYADAQAQFREQMHIAWQKVVTMQRNLEQYRSEWQTVADFDLLTIALEGGQITLIEFLMEQSVYQTAFTQFLEAERDMHKAYVELMQWTR